MARPQRSFFEQAPKDYPRWNGQWKPRDRPNTSSYIPKPLPNAAPIAASTQAKSKLKQFHFNMDAENLKPDGRQSSHREVDWTEDKENVVAPGPGSTKIAHQAPLGPFSSSQRSTGKDVRDCPQTPIGRLPLAELLANNDDSRQNMLATPMERVLWENSSLSSDPNTAVPSKKKRKRASSVSPISSSQNDTSGLSASKKVLNNLQTPKTDGVDDMWKRFSINTGPKEYSIGGDDVQFPLLMHSSSPQTPAPNPPRDASLRRALSCIEWPTSAAKRRKLHHNVPARKSAAAFAELDDQGQIHDMGNVGLIVEKMHSGLSKSRPKIVSPSPENLPLLPMAGDPKAAGMPASSPLSSSPVDKELAVQVNQEQIGGSSPPKHTSGAGVRPKIAVRDNDSFCYDDDDVDAHMANAARLGPNATRGEASLNEVCDGARTVADARGIDQPKLVKAQMANLVTDSKLKEQAAEEKPCSPHVAKCDDSDDEFDEGSDEFAADLEEVFAKYDTQQVGQDTEHQAVCQKTDAEPLAVTKDFAEDIQVEVVSSDDEDFGDDSDFEQLAAECAEVTQKQGSEPSPCGISDGKPAFLERYIVKSVAESNCEVRNGRIEPEKVLSIESEKTKSMRMVLLRGLWIDTTCEPGSCVHVVGDFDRFGQCVVDNMQNLLITNPDHLISSTVVGDSFTCIRKSVLQDRVKTTSNTSQGLVYGHILHEIFQEALRANRWDDDHMDTVIQAMVIKHLEALFEINIEPAIANEHLKAKVVDMQAWANIFVAATPQPNAVIKDRNGAQAQMCINKLLEVEEHVWAPTFGLKGNIDATVQIRLEDNAGLQTLTVPFELKTGKVASVAHKAQTALYSLLLSDRYDIDIACGILYYMQSSEISSIRTIRHELVPMIIQRNQIAHYVRQRETLPPMLRNPRTCGSCYAKVPCFVYHKLVDDGTGESSGLSDKFDELVGHLNPEHQRFFQKWDQLLTKEEADIVKTKKELWTLQSSERERLGRCFGGLIVEPGSFELSKDNSKINRFTYSLIKQQIRPGFSFTESELSVGEPVVVSDEQGHFALANGYVTRVRRGNIQISVDRRLHNARSKLKGFDHESNQVFSGIMEVIDKDGVQSTSTPRQLEEPVVYRLDKDEFSNGMALIRNNLVRLMEKDLFGVQALRRLIVENVPPTSKPAMTGYALGGSASQASLNVDQRAAIEKVMSAKDYALVLGMPGTGKTTTIAHIIRALIDRGKTVLLTSYTHSAVDNILLKLRNDKIGILRLGAIAKIHHEVQEFADLAAKPIDTVEELKRCYTRSVVATTCLGINHPIFNQRVFDYCIVDEASQITLPVCLGPIRMARTFILVGDHHQLPPLVANKEAQEGGLDISLFKMLSDRQPNSVVNLEHQYRMCEDIMTLSNTLIYSGQLKCGTQSVARRSLVVPNIDSLRLHHQSAQKVDLKCMKKICTGPFPSSCWLRDLIDHTVKACFVDTDRMVPRSREVLEAGSRITNPCEVVLISQLVQALLTTGIQPADIGVITLYRSQLALLKRSMRHMPEIEMHTADRFQGRDKEVILLSMVRSNEQRIVGDLLKDKRRVNVALTRARTKLLILGSKSTLVGNELLQELISLMDKRDWCYELPAHADEGHVFEEAETQISQSRHLDGDFIDSRPPNSGRLDGKETGGFGKKLAAKQARLDIDVLTKKRPVLRDIVNDAS